ncbi:TGFR2 protein, partial [Columbina picui]|nr:TGFR2 protein [Columbina picui]
RQDNESIRISTLCHNPHRPIENLMVPNYNTSRCIMSHQPSEDGIIYICGCVDEQECNDKLIFENHTNGYSMLQSKEVIPVAAISLLPPLLVAVMITVIFYLCRTQKRRKRAKAWGGKPRQPPVLPEPGRAAEREEKLSVLMDETPAAASPACASNRPAELLPIELDEMVGKGQFAEVWRAKLSNSHSGQYETVAVKIFPCEEYSSWKNESQIFTDASLKHDSVLRFLTAEDRGTGPRREYWLITAYHSRGNLKDYLSRHFMFKGDSSTPASNRATSPVSSQSHILASEFACSKQLTTLLFSPACPAALSSLFSSLWFLPYPTYLHYKPMKLQEAPTLIRKAAPSALCAPCLAVGDPCLDQMPCSEIAPEPASQAILPHSYFTCVCVKNYELPFGSKVQEQPCVDTMRDIVLHGRGRPEIPSSWLVHQGMRFLCDTITECWDHDPEARLTAHCVAERFNLMAQMDCDDILNNNTDNEASKTASPSGEHQDSDGSRN